MPRIPTKAASVGLHVRGLCKAYGNAPVLTGIDLDVASGELVTVLGASGAGKTTLLRILCGFERADAGRITLGGREVANGRALHVAPERRGIGYVAQEGALFPHLSVAENILFGLPRRLRKAKRAAAGERVQQLLALMDLPEQYASRMPSILSGGEQQRVALARALAPGPAVVLLDEPFSALDAGLRVETRTAVLTSLKRAGATALLVTHDQDEALSMSDRVAVLLHGRLAQVSDPRTLYRLPVDADVARFVGAALLLPGTLEGDVAACRLGALRVAPSVLAGLAPGTRAVDVMIRPEQIHLDRADGAPPQLDGGERNARVEDLTFYGHDAELALRLDSDLRVTAWVPGVNLPAIGDEVAFHVVGPVVAYPRATAHADR
ncbi:MAG TPA: ABC transporter ATP-binding protein [Rhodanobacteraceae bacterium]|nr:ABC transporter ATP-binding protein [Rhodanobacteraceae bacterium]